MAKTLPPVVGFNNNVRHRGQVFHIQTEDSGVSKPHIITHLFADGGRIIDTSRQDYGDHRDRPDLPTFVRDLMKEQHKEMFVRLRSGALDERIGFPADAPPPVPVQPSPGKGSQLPVAPHPTRPQMAAVRPESTSLAARAGLANPLLHPRTPESVSSGEVELDVADFLPPSSAVPQSLSEVAPASSRPPVSAPFRPEAGKSDAAVPRYASARPAAIFGEPAGIPRSIFGDSLISEKSLDEVILSYLSDDLEPPQE